MFLKVLKTKSVVVADDENVFLKNRHRDTDESVIPCNDDEGK